MKSNLGVKLVLIKASYASLGNLKCAFGDSCMHRAQRQEKSEPKKCAFQQEHRIKVLLLYCIFISGISKISLSACLFHFSHRSMKINIS